MTSDNAKRKDALRLRTLHFACRVVELFRSNSGRSEDIHIVGKQLLRSGTSVAANYREASRARSRNEFLSKIQICIQEADETDLWLSILRDGCGQKNEIIEWLLVETDELISIFVTMVRNTQNNNQKPEM